MNERPAILIEFDPDTWEIVAVFYKAANNEQTAALQSFLIDGMRTAAKTAGASIYAA